ncbi:MAG: ATP-grasp domain-containing protein [Planctomycetia bacterium]|nr:ATP-grasp domain-containing protein [Planctomycetia bacterium]
MTVLPPSLLILGGSTRAAAGSAVRAGFRPVCADRFGDDDLLRLATVLPVHDYPHGLIETVQSLSPTPWIYVGALENEPELIAAISHQHPLLGNSPEVLQRVRDPFWIERTLRDSELPTLQNIAEDAIPPSGEQWLMKPLRSGGGIGIRLWSGVRQDDDQQAYFQERRAGRSISAIFIATSHGARFIGTSEQLIGLEAGAPTEFGYAGSIGPIELNRSTSHWIQQIGTLLASESGLRGLFGCDFILADDVPWLTEINPRYTASVEVLERATSWPLLKWHALACLNNMAQLDGELPLTGSVLESMAPNSRKPIVGKRIVFSANDSVAIELEKRVAADSCHPNSIWRMNNEDSFLADIPAPESPLFVGWPICTVFARETTVAECRKMLGLRASAISRWINASMSSPRPPSSLGH